MAVMCSASATDSHYGTLPYKTLLETLQKADGLRDLDHLSVSVTVSSTLPNVSMQDITLTIRDKSDPIILAVDKTGQFTLPVTPELQAENPDVVSNQPKGTLDLNVTINIRPPKTTTVRYSDLMAGAMQFNAAIKRQAGMLSWFAPHVDGILLVYANGGTHRAIIGTGVGSKTIVSVPLASLKNRLKLYSIGHDASAATAIVLETDEVLLKQDPYVKLDALPDGVGPLT